MVETLKHEFEIMRPVLDERGHRLWAGAEADAIGRGGVSRVAQATGMSRATVRQGIKVTHDRMIGLSIRRTGFHGEWNYTLLPRR